MQTQDNICDVTMMNLSYLSLLFGLICYAPKVNLDPVEDVGDVGFRTSNVIKEISGSLSTLKKNEYMELLTL